MSSSAAEPPIAIERLADHGPLTDRQMADLDEIFFTSSARQSFAGATERAAFRERWLARYLQHDRQWFYLALEKGAVAGYLAGAVDDPALAARFQDIGYWPLLADLTARFPAHLHINVAANRRSSGIGGRLIEAFVADLVACGCPGVHLVTGEGSRNIAFYQRNGFTELRSVAWGDKRVVMLGRLLHPQD